MIAQQPLDLNQLPIDPMEEPVQMNPVAQTQVLRPLWRRATFALTIVLTATIGLLIVSSAARAAADEYGIESVEAEATTLQAGAHPDVSVYIDFKDSLEPHPGTERLSVELPPGLTGNTQKFPQCTFIQFLNFVENPCPQESQVGIIEVLLEGDLNPVIEPLYILKSPDDQIARFGFIGLLWPYVLEVDLRSDSDYGVNVVSNGIPGIKAPSEIETTVWGVPADSEHDGERLSAGEAVGCSFFGIEDGSPCFAACPFNNFVKCLENGFFPAPGEERPSFLAPEPFITNPANCGPMIFGFEATSYALPGQVFRDSASAGDITGCEKVPFDPSLSLKPTSSRAGAPTGLEATLEIPQEEAVNTLGSSPLRTARVTLPEGMTINSSAADGLAACSPAQAAYKTPNAAACPEASKVGSAEFVSPALKRPIQGGIFLRTPEPGHLFRFWLVSNELGVNLKLPAEVELDPNTGRLTTVIQESPQVPAEKVVLRLNGGAKAPLRNPKSCGTSNASFALAPWSGNPPVTGVVPITIDQGCKTGGFSPKLSAGTRSPSAGAYSPFMFDVSQEDGEQNLAKVDVSLPQGLTAKLAGVSLCSDGAASTGACPEGSRIGAVKAAAGAGTEPLWIPQPGKSPTALYLAGPYKGAPYSVVATVPAQAGPFDLGVVVVRSAIYVDPETAAVTVKSDPLPQILQGVPIDYRHVRVEVNRDKFTLNPTSCAVKAVQASLTSAAGATASASDRFQAADCASLGFSPKLTLKLKGGTQRSDHPRLRAVLQAKAGQANIRRVSVALPHSEFLDQAHIQTVCTRVQFAANACPKGSIYGHASATTPLLDKPLRGPVYLRSSSHKLPDMVVDLRGQINVVLAGRIDSVNGGIRTTFEDAPDAPIQKFVLNMKGGKKGLLVNSRNLCASRQFASVKMDGQNGKLSDSRPVLQNGC